MLKKLICAGVIIIFTCSIASALDMQILSAVQPSAGQIRTHLSGEVITSDSVSPSFEPMYIFYGAKLTLSLLLAGTAVTDTDSDAPELAVLGISSLLTGLPSFAVMYHARAGRKDELKKWRKIAFAADLAMSACLAGYGISELGSGGISRQYAGLVSLTAGTAGALLSTLNLRRFAIEDEDTGRD